MLGALGLAALALWIAPLAETKSLTCGGKRATIKPKGKSGKTKKLTGTQGDDVIVSEGGKQKIKGLGGNDTICPGKGKDKINSGDGDDLIFGGGGADSIDGSTGNDTIHGEPGGDQVQGGPGVDNLLGEDGGDNLDGGEDNDTVNGQDGADNLKGGSGVDMVLGERGADSADGGEGDGDTVLSGIDNDRGVTGGPGNADIVRSQSGDDENVSGGDGAADKAIGGFGNDEVDGGNGDNDLVQGNNGTDKLNGGGGSGDIVSYADSTPGENSGETGVTVNLNSGGAGGEGDDSLAGFEEILGSPFDDTLIGNGASKIDGFEGGDLCSSGNATTFISCNDRPGPNTPPPAPDVCRRTQTCVSLDPNRLDGVPKLLALGTTAVNAVTVEFGGGAFTVTDSAAGVQAQGGCVQAGNNAAVCQVSVLPDTVLVATREGNDSLTLGAGVPTLIPYKLNGGVDNDVVNGGPGDDLVDGGTSGIDVMNGNGGSDVLNSRAGTDIMNGGDGEDLLETNTPCDGHVFNGGGGTDNAAFAPSFGYDVTATIGGGAFDKGKANCNPSQVQSSNEYLEGSPGNDELTGDNSNNSILGRAGRDVMNGMGGNDVMNGLEGADTFIGGDGIDELRAQDGTPDDRIDCGPPNKAAEIALVDGADPKPIGCKAKKKKGKKKK